MSAPKKIYCVVDCDGHTPAESREMAELYANARNDADDEGAPFTVLELVPASELEAVQSRLDALVKAATDVRVRLWQDGHESQYELQDAIESAKGGG